MCHVLPAGCRLLMVRVLFELKAKTMLKNLYEGPFYRAPYAYTLFIHFRYTVPISVFFVCAKTHQKNMCVKLSPPFC